MLESNTLPTRQCGHGQYQQPESDDASPSEALSSQGGRPGAADHESDSWRSHLWFGLATVALVVPFLIPGLPRRGLLVTYVGAGSVLMITPIVWGLIRSTRDAWQVRKARPRRGFWLGKE